MPRLTVGKAIRAMCLRCEGAETAHRAYDCLGVSCPLYPAHPFRMKTMPSVVGQGKAGRERELTRMEQAHAAIPQRRPSKAMLARKCRECLAQDEPDCPVTDCPLWPWRPMQPGGMPKNPRRQAAMTPIRRKTLEAEGKRAQIGKREKPMPRGLAPLFRDGE